MSDSTARAEAEKKPCDAHYGTHESCPCCREVQALRDEVERLTRERDEAIRGNLESGNIQVHGLTMRQILELKCSAEAAEAKLREKEQWVSMTDEVERNIPMRETYKGSPLVSDWFLCWDDFGVEMKRITETYTKRIRKWKTYGNRESCRPKFIQPLPSPPTEGKDK